MIRAKFRVMSRTTNWDGSTSLKLMPVTRHRGGAEDTSFWEATPAGEGELWFLTAEAPNYEPDECLYVDMEEREDGEWSLASICRHNEQLDVKLVGPWSAVHRSPWFELCVTNRGVWPQLQKDPGTKWAVTISAADEEE